MVRRLGCEDWSHAKRAGSMRFNHPESLVSFFALLALIFFLQGGVSAHVEHSKDLSGIGIDEKLGQPIPLDLSFTDENGNVIDLRRLIHTPTILAPVYYHCPNV